MRVAMFDINFESFRKCANRESIANFLNSFSNRYFELKVEWQEFLEVKN